MQSTIDSNKKSWFALDAKIKKYRNNSPSETVKTNEKGLLKRQDKAIKREPQLDVSSRYIMAIRDAFEANKKV